MSEQVQTPPSRDRRGDAQAYWQALQERKLIVPKCRRCGETFFYPRPFCPFCMSDDTTWVTSTGRGRIYSFTVTARAPRFKIPAMVTLDEGPTMMTAIETADPAAVFIGQEVVVDFARLADGTALPVFRPADDAHGA
jgi:uncharacterized OB-fold protein